MRIFSVLTDLDISAAMGPDGICARLLKFFAVVLMQVAIVHHISEVFEIVFCRNCG